MTSPRRIFEPGARSVIAFEQMLSSKEGSRLSVKTMVEPVAEALGNTVAMSRKSYVHPRLIEAVREFTARCVGGCSRRLARRRWLSSAEAGMIAFLKKKPRRQPSSKGNG